MTPQKSFSRVIKPIAIILLISMGVGFVFFGITHNIPLLNNIPLHRFITGKYKLFEQNTLYWRFQWRRKKNSESKQPLNSHIAIIGIDSETLKGDNLPQVFWDKRLLPVFKMLLENNVKVIGLDRIQNQFMSEALKEIFDEEFLSMIRDTLKETIGPEVYEKDRIDEWIESLLEENPIVNRQKELNKLFFKTKKVVIPTIVSPKHELTNKPIPQMITAAGEENLAIVNLPTSEDNVAINQELIFDTKKGDETVQMHSFGLRIVEKFLDKTASEIDDKMFLENREIPTDEERKLLINFTRPVIYPDRPGKSYDENTAYSFKTVLVHALEGDNEYFKRNFEDKIVLIGLVLPAEDVFLTPFGKHVLMPGVEIHAHIIRTLLDRDYLQKAKDWVNFLILLSLCIISGIITYKFEPWQALALCLSLVAFYIYITFRILFYNYSIWVDVMQVICVVFVFGGVYSYKYIDEEKERKRIRKIFGRYVSKNVMEAILSNPKNLDLGGTRRKVTVLFSDINNFTPQSEKLSPEELMRYLNRYFNDMNAIILKYNGTIKQFVGDEIMVLYGAPMDQDDQAVRAVNTALEMVDRLNFLKKNDPKGTRGFYDVKIGIHTGEVVAGNVGSEERTEYACVGDNVNLTSRIEGLNKKLGTTILISEETYKEVKGKIENAEFIPFEPQEVKGKKNLINVYEVRRPKQGE